MTRETEGRDRTVAAFFLAWAAGVGFLWWLATPLLIRGKGRPGVDSNALVLLALWLAGAMAAGLVGGVAAPNRVPGAAFGVLVWAAAGLLVQRLRARSTAQQFRFVRGLILIGAAQGLVGLIAVWLHPSRLSTFRLPSAMLLGGDSGVAPWTRANFAYQDYFGGAVLRSAGLMSTAAWSGGFACLVVLTLILGRQRLREAGMSRRAWMIAGVLNAAGLYLSYSRVSWAIAIGVLALAALYRVCSVLVLGSAFATTMAVIGGIVMLLVAPWQQFVLDQDSLRPGSSDTRLVSYIEGLNAATSHGPLATVAGLGVKPYVAEIGAGAGSESTYVSLLVRGGLIALALFAVFLVARLVRAWRSGDAVSIALIAATSVHAAVEDLDVGTLTLLFLLLPVGLLSGQREDPPPGTVTSRGRDSAALSRAH